ncbi:hypothetical protein ACLOJK_023073 [Asimina triloba]
MSGSPDRPSLVSIRSAYADLKTCLPARTCNERPLVRRHRQSPDLSIGSPDRPPDRQLKSSSLPTTLSKKPIVVSARSNCRQPPFGVPLGSAHQ